jgi:hypothetical protein
MRLIRDQGNHQGRQRANRNLEQRMTYYPRGIILATGENLPPTGDSDSLKARTLIIRMVKGEIALADIIKLNKEVAPVLPHAMKGYIDYLQPRLDVLPDELQAILDNRIEQATQLNGHHRVSNSTANLFLGMVTALQYALSVGAVKEDESARMLSKCWQVLTDLARKQNFMLNEDRASHGYLTVLHTLLSQGKAVLAPKDQSQYRRSPRNGQSVLGWFDSEFMYLDLSEPYRVVQQFFRESGQALTASNDDLKFEFKEAGLSVCDTDRANRTDKTVTIEGKKRRLVHLKIAEIEKLIEVDGLADTLRDGWRQYNGMI